LTPGWVYLPKGSEIRLDTPCLIPSDDDPVTDWRGIPVEAVHQGFPEPGLDQQSIEDAARCAAVLMNPPTDELLLESFLYDLRFDAFLPAIGPPPPQTGEEAIRRSDREFYDAL
jgi:hypothetical protein